MTKEKIRRWEINLPPISLVTCYLINNLMKIKDFPIIITAHDSMNCSRPIQSLLVLSHFPPCWHSWWCCISFPTFLSDCILPCRSSDELYAYLTHCRPDLCLLEGGEEEGGADREEEEFVVIEDKEEEEEDEEEEEVFQRHQSSGDDWEVSGFMSVADLCK